MSNMIQKENSNFNQTIAQQWRQGSLIQITITDLSSSGDGVGRFGERVVFVPNTVSGDRALVRLVRVKPDYANGKLVQLLDPSPQRIRSRCLVADKCGGCQWHHVDDAYQRIAKRGQVINALERIGGFAHPPVAPILAIAPLEYRNKATYPLAVSATGQVQAGYYRKGTHQLVNLNHCPVQDIRLDPLLAVKQDLAQRGWSIYNEKHHRGQLRHLALRIGRRTGEMLLTLVTTDLHLNGIEAQAHDWMQRYPRLVGVALNYNPKRINAIFGAQTQIVAGQPYLREIFAGIELQLRPDTFFQVNTETAEALLTVILEQLNLQGTETLLDAYCGIGTFTLPLAQKVRQAIGIEVQPVAVEQAQQNAQLNGITNVTFQAGTVETLLPELNSPDIVLLNPPRKGCDRAVIESLLKLQPSRLVYVSCNPATLARDLKWLCQSRYRLNFVQPADFFPQTAHVECAVFLGH